MNKQQIRRKEIATRKIIDYGYRLNVTGTIIIIQGILLALLSLIAAAFNDTGDSFTATVAPIAFFYFIATIPVGVAVVRSASNKFRVKQRWLATMAVILPLITVGLSLVTPPLADIALLPSLVMSLVGCIWLLRL